MLKAQAIILQAAEILTKKPEEHVRNITTYAERLQQLILLYAPRVITAIITLAVGLWLIRMLGKALSKIMAARDVDATLRPFLRTIITIALKLMLILTVAGMIGIETTSFMAALGAAGLAIGLALQGSLSNFAGGVLILLFRPFRVGDVIEAQTHIGTVNEIQILYTILTTADNKKVIIPNGNLSNNSVINYTANPLRRAEIKFVLAHNADIAKAKAILQQLIYADERILKDPMPQVSVVMLTDMGVNINAFAWAKREDFLTIQYDLYERAKSAFDAEGIELAKISAETQQRKR